MQEPEGRVVYSLEEPLHVGENSFGAPMVLRSDLEAVVGCELAVLSVSLYNMVEGFVAPLLVLRGSAGVETNELRTENRVRLEVRQRIPVVLLPYVGIGVPDVSTIHSHMGTHQDRKSTRLNCSH